MLVLHQELCVKAYGLGHFLPLFTQPGKSEKHLFIIRAKKEKRIKE